MPAGIPYSSLPTLLDFSDALQGHLEYILATTPGITPRVVTTGLEATSLPNIELVLHDADFEVDMTQRSVIPWDFIMVWHWHEADYRSFVEAVDTRIEDSVMNRFLDVIFSSGWQVQPYTVEPIQKVMVNPFAAEGTGDVMWEFVVLLKSYEAPEAYPVAAVAGTGISVAPKRASEVIDLPPGEEIQVHFEDWFDIRGAEIGSDNLSLIAPTIDPDANPVVAVSGNGEVVGFTAQDTDDKFESRMELAIAILDDQGQEVTRSTAYIPVRWAGPTSV